MVKTAMILLLLLSSPVLAGERLLVFAAASQRDAMLEIGAAYETQCQCRVVFSFAATSTLARQIAAGAKADVFVSADRSWADWLETETDSKITKQHAFASNRLVIASAAPTRDSFNILMRGRFVMADPVSVPAGIFARQALERMGVWNGVMENAVYAENVRVALAKVRRGDLLSGIIYQSDLHDADNLHAHYLFPEDLHEPIRHMALAVGRDRRGEQFVDFLVGANAQEILSNKGFLLLENDDQKQP